MNYGGTILVIVLTLVVGAGLAYVLWICFVKPRVEGARSNQQQEEQARDTDLIYIQEEAERVKDSAQSIKEHVTRLQQMAYLREQVEKEHQAQREEEQRQ